MAPIRRPSQRLVRSRSHAVYGSHESSLTSAFSGLGISDSPQENPSPRTPQRIFRHYSQRNISNGSYFQQRSQRPQRNPRALQRTLTASEELQQAMNDSPPRRRVSSRNFKRRVVSAGDIVPDTTASFPLPRTWDPDKSLLNAPQADCDNLEVSNRMSEQQRQAPQHPDPYPGLPRLHLSPRSPCERGPGLSEEERNILLRSMPRYKSSSSPSAAEYATPHNPHLLPSSDYRRSSDDSAMHGVEHSAGSKDLTAWPMNGNLLATTGTGGSAWGLTENGLTMADYDLEVQGRDTGNMRMETWALDSPRYPSGDVHHDAGTRANQDDVDAMTQLFENQRLAGQGNYPSYMFPYAQ